MACNKVVAETLTITGSIGVVTGKFNLAEAYNRIGYNKEIISRGRYAELLAENKPFTPDEAALFDAGAEYAYSQFRDKAALSRGMAVDAMEEVAQGRVWSGKGAASKGLVDALGGLWRAVALAKEAAGLKPEDKVTLLEVSRASVSPLALLAGGGATAGLPGMAMLGLLLQSVFGGNSMGGVSPAAAVGAPVLFDALLTAAAVGGGPLAGVGGSLEEALMLRGLSSGAVMAQLPGLEVDGVASQALRSSGLDASWSELFADC